MKRISPAILTQLFLLLVIFLCAGIIFFEMIPYISGILGAITLYVLLRKPMKKLVKKKWPPTLAAIFLLVLSSIGILIPIGGVILLLGNKISYLVNNWEKVFTAIKNEISKLENYFGYSFTSDIDPSSASGYISDSLQGIAGGTFNTVLALFIMYFLLYYMLINDGYLRKNFAVFLPLKPENVKLVGKEIAGKVRSNALGIPLVAVAQGIVALIGFLIFGIENALFWFAMVAIGSMIPFVGGLLGIVPAFILTYANGDVFNAWGILAYGFFIVGSTDNVIRLYVLKKIDNVHPLITLVGVLIGVPLFGFIGLIFGPLLISLFLVVLKIYKKEYITNSND
ncbi:MAG: AI-2E family transporter [Flavobacteriales bacterium]|nr:MAG: AI-2E family transporter [Flavobacteriales bacterium]PIE49644.1 MAG: AI-2E family transporter [Flavobacteriales bacterium]